MLFKTAYTFDDVLLVPRYSNINPQDVSLRTEIIDGISINIPFISAPMDTITEHEMAVSLAQCGGLGVIHRNMSIEQQVIEVKKVKKHEGWIVYDPITVSSDTKVHEVLRIMKNYKYSGFPVVDQDNKVLGIVTNRDIRFVDDLEQPVSELMTKDNLVTIKEAIEPSEALRLLHKHRIEKLIVVTDDYKCSGLITVKDIESFQKFPNACKDSKARLRVGAAVGVGDEGMKRALALIEAEVDMIFIDTAHGHSADVLATVSTLRALHNNLPIIAGNVVTSEGATALIDAGANCVKVGVGPGSICTTRVVAGVGMPQLTAITNVRDICKKRGVKIIADGGITTSGDIAKAIAAGADAVMMGFMFAGAKENPGDIIMLKDRTYKRYRGMGSLGAMKKESLDRYMQGKMHNKIPEGVEGQVPLRGSVVDIADQLSGGLRIAMGYTGNQTINDMQNNCTFIHMTAAGLRESHPHDVTITHEDIIEP